MRQASKDFDMPKLYDMWLFNLYVLLNALALTAFSPELLNPLASVQF